MTLSITERTPREIERERVIERNFLNFRHALWEGWLNSTLVFLNCPIGKVSEWQRHDQLLRGYHHQPMNNPGKVLFWIVKMFLQQILPSPRSVTIYLRSNCIKDDPVESLKP